jgi:hypothetical protein
MPGFLVELMRQDHEHCPNCGTRKIELICWNTKRSFLGKSRCRRPLEHGEGKFCRDCGGLLEAILPYIPKLARPAPVLPPRPLQVEIVDHKPPTGPR